MKAELARIEDRQNVAKEIREIWEFKKPHILKALKKSQIRAVNNILVRDRQVTVRTFTCFWSLFCWAGWVKVCQLV